MESKKGKLSICSRGHEFYKGSEQPVCPTCWPGRYKKTDKPKKHTHYQKDGSIWAKGSILDGKMHGQWIWFRKDGSKMRAGKFEKDKQVGRWTTYDKYGTVVKVTNFT